MIVPNSMTFTSIPPAGVFTYDAIAYYLKIDANTAVNLASGATVASTALPGSVTYFPNASLNLG